MAEYCVDCLNEIFETDYSPKHFILSDDYCEKCGRYTKTVVMEKRYFYRRFLIIPFIPLILVIYILAIPYILMKHIMERIN